MSLTRTSTALGAIYRRLAARRLQCHDVVPPSVFNALYEPAPTGFTRAIEIGERLLQEEQHRKSTNLHVWMACAYAQKYRHSEDEGANAEELAKIKDAALREIDAALLLDPNSKKWLQSPWKPAPSVMSH